MSHHMSLSAKYSGRSLNFPPAQSSFGLSFGKASSDAGGGGTYFATYLHQVWCVTDTDVLLNTDTDHLCNCVTDVCCPGILNEKVLKYLIITQEYVNIFQIHFNYLHLKKFTKFLPCIKVITCLKENKFINTIKL